MIFWTLHKKDDQESSTVELKPERKYQLKESDHVQFQVEVSNDKLGKPTIIIGDIPIELELSHSNENSLVFITPYSVSENNSRYFYNFFGESEVSLYFENTIDLALTVKFDILAQPRNALLANEMLDYLTNNVEDAIAICFSRSKQGVSLTEDHKFSFSKIHIIVEAVEFITSHLPVFNREHKSILIPNLTLSQQGQPTGPDSVFWALSNLDKISPSSTEESNLVFNNKAYRFDELPKENLISNTDVFENRVINSFLQYVSQFLLSLGGAYTAISEDKEPRVVENEYVRFDHTMSKYSNLVLKHKVKEIEILIHKVNSIRVAFNKRIPSKIKSKYFPKITSYVAKHSHYRKAFTLIEQFYRAPAPSFKSEQFLLGLKNLSIIYELSTLLQLHDAIKECFKATMIESNYRNHSEILPFGGEVVDRPIGEINNYFMYENEKYEIDIFYEPKIYPMNASSKSGDLVDTSNSNSTLKYGKHHFCPDFIIRIKPRSGIKPLVVVLDAKYKDAQTIRNYDLEKLTRKYLLNVHQINTKRNLSLSSIELLLILFPHEENGKKIQTVSNNHYITGSHPVIPQLAGILLKPSNSKYLHENFLGLIDIINKMS